MASTFLKPDKIVKTAIGLLQREIVLPRLVWTDPKVSAEVVGAKDDTVSMRLAAVATAREYGWRNDRSASIVLDDLTETKVDVVLNHDIYHGTPITDEQLTLDIADFGSQVLMPQMRGVAEGLENLIASTIASATFDETVGFEEGAAGKTGDPYLVAVEARKVLNKANVPFGERVILLGADVEAAFLASDKLVKVNESGTESALREAVIGRLAGFTLVTSNAIDADKAYAFHRTAFAWLNVAPEIPDGASAGARSSYEGLAMRWIKDYDPTKLRDRSIVSSFAGCTSVEDDGVKNVRAVEIEFTPAGS